MDNGSLTYLLNNLIEHKLNNFTQINQTEESHPMSFEFTENINYMNHLEFDLPKDKSSIIKVIGIGGAGSNAVNHMHQKGIKGVNFIVANTDEQHLNMSPIKTKILLGPELTKGLGTGADPEIGKLATEESIEQLREELGHGTRMLFIAAGMGKGTGTGGSPVVAKLAREMGILTVAIVTTPFSMLGKSAIKKADEGMELLKENVDALIVVANDKILEIYGNQKVSDAFHMADDILKNAAKGIAEIITGAGIHNTDFNDVRMVLESGGMTIMGIGYAQGEDRATLAVKNAIESPLLDKYDIAGAKKALVNISYSENHDCTLQEIGQIIDAISEAAQTDIEIIYGTGVDNTLEDELAVTIIVTGFSENDSIHTKSASKKEVIDIDQPSNETNPNDIIILENQKQIVIDFGTPSHQDASIFSDLESALSNQNLDDDFIKIEESKEAQFYDEMGRNIEETDEDKRKRMLSQLSFDVNSPLNSSDNFEMNLEPISNKSNLMITQRDNLFKVNNLIDPDLD